MQPAMVIGHSAGAAVAARLMLLHLIAPVPIVSLNGALSPMPQHQGAVYSLMARLLTNGPAASWMFAMQARREKTVDRLLAATGSRIDGDGRKFYARLMSRPGSRRRGLADDGALESGRPSTCHSSMCRVTLIAGDRDGMVPPEDATRVEGRLPQGRVVLLPGLGHLAHEEEPGMVARLIEGSSGHGSTEPGAADGAGGLRRDGPFHERSCHRPHPGPRAGRGLPASCCCTGRPAGALRPRPCWPTSAAGAFLLAAFALRAVRRGRRLGRALSRFGAGRRISPTFAPGGWHDRRPPTSALAPRLSRPGRAPSRSPRLFLPGRVRAPATALYAFCRAADDAIDLTEDRAAALLTLRARLDAIYAGTLGRLGGSRLRPPW